MVAPHYFELGNIRGIKFVTRTASRAIDFRRRRFRGVPTRILPLAVNEMVDQPGEKACPLARTMAQRG